MATQPDRLTLIALGILAFTLKATLHEWVAAPWRRYRRRGGIATALGSPSPSPPAVWSRSAGRSRTSSPRGSRRLASASVAGAQALGTGAFFLWLVFVANLLSAGGYMMVDPLFGFGDGSAFIASYGAAWSRWPLIAVGLGLSLVGLISGRPSGRPSSWGLSSMTARA